ncbi:hypothetical protein [Streptomyces sp. NPDC056796]|uniref:hypothetical protein n=1 Tax=Streptomyces sp. NPDC056796 TaxID=3345947 RepID=UPI00367A6984
MKASFSRVRDKGLPGGSRCVPPGSVRRLLGTNQGLSPLSSPSPSPSLVLVLVLVLVLPVLVPVLRVPVPSGRAA